MAPNPSISVIVPTYHRDTSLTDCLSSVLGQDYAGGVELIVVDQSKGHTQQVADFLRSHGGQLRVIQQAQPNLPKARNAGIAAACGEVFLFVDDDVVLPPNTIRTLAEHFCPFQLKVISGLVISEKDPETCIRAYGSRFGAGSVSDVQGLRRVEQFIGALMMVPAKAVQEVGGFDASLGRLTPTAYGEDDDFCYRLRRAGVPLFIDPRLRVVHKDHLAGGCASRSIDPTLARKYHMKSMVYIRTKHHGKLGVGGWLQLARAYIANREVLRRGPGQILQNLTTARRAVNEVRAFMAEDRRRACAGGPLRTRRQGASET